MSNTHLTTCDQEFDQEPLTIDEFNKYFTNVNFIGQGSYGNVYECVDDTQSRICALKIVPANNYRMSISFEEETDKACKIWDLFHKYIDTLHPVWYRGYIDRKIMDDPNLDLVLEKDEDDDDDDVVVSYMTMPLIDDPDKASISVRDTVDIYFEIVISILFLNGNNYQHNDLNRGNILFRQVDYDRVYTVNGKKYIVKTRHQPVFIDWGADEPLESDYDNDLMKFAYDYSLFINSKREIPIPKELINAINEFGYSTKVLDIDYFSELKTESIGDKVKYLLEMKIK